MENLLKRAKSIFSFLRIRYIFVLSEAHISANSFTVICFCFRTSSIRLPICICIVVAILSYLLPNSYCIPTTAKKEDEQFRLHCAVVGITFKNRQNARPLTSICFFVFLENDLYEVSYVSQWSGQ